MTLPSGTIINSCYIFSTYDDSYLLNTISGAGFGKLYQNDDHLYLYNVSSGLVQDPDSEINALSIYSNIKSICTTLGNVLVITKSNNLTNTAIYTKPIVSGIFVLESILPNIISDCSLADDGHPLVDIPVLLGNSRLSSASRIVRSNLNTAPISPFTKSDTGIIPSGLVLITDLEAGIL
jgi:hypothetical protein